MKKSILFFAIAIIAFVFACNQVQEKAEKVSDKAEEMTEESSEEATADSLHFGEFIDANGAVNVEQFASMMEGKDSLQVKISAVATEVCQKKGCWMKVQMAEGESMRIRFKDYGFFVPKDISGKEVVFAGIAFKDTISVEDLKHYAMDGRQSEEEIAAITEPEIKTAFLAHGVMIK